MKKQSIISILLVLIMTSGFVFAKPRYISPNNDGIQDEIVIPISISDRRYVQGWSLVVLDENKNVVRTIENKIALPQKLGFKMFFKQLIAVKQGVPVPESITWNGVMNNGETAPDGRYFWYVTATDDNGNVGQTKEHEIIIDTVAPEIELTQPTDKIFGEGAKATLKIQQEGSAEDEWIGVFKSADGNVVKTYKWTNAEPETFVWKGTEDEDVQIADGVYSYEITATDRAGTQLHEQLFLISSILQKNLLQTSLLTVHAIFLQKPKAI